MNALFYLGHPAHFHMLKNPMRILESRGVAVSVAARRKDILEELLRSAGRSFHNLMPRKRGAGTLGTVVNLAVRDIRMLRLARELQPDVLVGTSVEITHIGRLIGKPSLLLCEDDADVVPRLARVAFPFATAIISPNVCRTGRWENKKIGYAGYQKLAYLHPQWFTPNKIRVQALISDVRPYYIVRMVELTAHHDVGARGLTSSLVEEVIRRLSSRGRVYLSTEGPLPARFEQYRLDIDPLDIHHALAFSAGYVGDSQSMAVEAAMLGIPSIRFSDFAGRISVLEELEHKYHLTVGIAADDPQRLLAAVDRLVTDEYSTKLWGERREKMLSEKIDVASFWSHVFIQFMSAGLHSSVAGRCAAGNFGPGS